MNERGKRSDFLPSNFSRVQPFVLLCEPLKSEENLDEKIPFGERYALIGNEKDKLMSIYPCAGVYRHKKYKSKPIRDSGLLRENLGVMVRLQQLKSFMLHSRSAKPLQNDRKNREKLIVDDFILQNGDQLPQRYVPPVEVISESQARQFIKEMVAVTTLHSGYQCLREQATETLVDIGIEFITKIGTNIRKEMDRLAQCSNSTPPLLSDLPPHQLGLPIPPSLSDLPPHQLGLPIPPSLSDLPPHQLGIPIPPSGVPIHHPSIYRKTSTCKREIQALATGLSQCGCAVEDLSHHLTQIVRYGDSLRVIDRRLLKKGIPSKSPSDKGTSIQSELKLTPLMAEALISLQPGLAFCDNKFKSTGKDAPIPTTTLSSFQDHTTTTLSKKTIGRKRTTTASELPHPKKTKEASVVEASVAVASVAPTSVAPTSAPALLENHSLSQTTKLEIEQLDEALATTAKRTTTTTTTSSSSIAQETNNTTSSSSNGILDISGLDAVALEAELDLSNLDDFFDGDMLGDDMLPSIF